MNRIRTELVQTICDYGECYWMIDGRPVVRYLNEAVNAGACPRLEVFGFLEGLLPAWTGEPVWKAENCFIWEMVDSVGGLNVSVPVCEGDCDSSCIAMMAKIRKEPDTVYWDSLGVLNLENQDFWVEEQSDVLCLEEYPDQDWEGYGDNITCEQSDSPEYRKWVSEHWDEKMIRRRRNYMKFYMQREENITRICPPLWQFERKEYERMVEDYRKIYEDRMGRDRALEQNGSIWEWGREFVKFPYVKNPLRLHVYRRQPAVHPV